MKKAIFSALTAVLMLSSCASPIDMINDQETDSVTSEDAQKTRMIHAEIPVIPEVSAGSPDEDNAPPVIGDDMGYTDDEGIFIYKRDGIYRELKDMCLNFENERVIDGIIENYEEFLNAWLYLFNYDADIFWTNKFIYEDIGDGKTRLTMTMRKDIADKDTEELSEMHDELMKKVDEIVSLANEKSTDYEKIQFVHDLINESTTYKYRDYFSYHNTAYGCLIEGESDVDGYAAAFELIMQELGFTCGICEGERTAGSFQWNYIWFGDDYYWIDVGDDDWEDESSRIGTRHYFFMTSSDYFYIEKFNDDRCMFKPECSSTTYDYFCMNDLLLDKYSRAKIDSIYMACNEDHFEVKFKNPEDYRRAVAEIYKGKRHDAMEIDKEDFWISIYEPNRSMMLYWDTDAKHEEQ